MGFSTFLHSGGTVTQMRGLAFLALSETARILSGSVVSDGGGGGTTVWRAVGTTDCRIYPLATSSSSRFVGGAISENSTHMIRLPTRATVDLDDRIVVGSRGTFSVLMAPERTGELTKTIEVIKLD